MNCKFLISVCLLICLAGCDAFSLSKTEAETSAPAFRYEEIPEYSGDAYVTVNGNVPFNTADNNECYIHPGELDELGRCTDVEAVVGPETLPQTSRESIGDIRPSGWHTVRYDELIESKYLYNRCHLIAYEFSGVNKDTRVLITGTRYLNIEGMLPFENQITSYIKRTGNHVYYHAVPVFMDNELVCRGVLLEAASIEDSELRFCVFCYNVYPGILINYADGTSEPETAITRSMPSSAQEYVLNINTMRFHHPDCDSVTQMKEKNKREVFADREELIDQGYVPCGVCNP